MIVYPESFVKKAQRVYPSWGKLHELIQKGSASVGHMLLEAREYNIPLATILAADSLEELKDKAQRMKEGQELALEWHAIIEAHRSANRKKVLKEIEERHKIT